jgi:hypothetical protein
MIEASTEQRRVKNVQSSNEYLHSRSYLFPEKCNVQYHTNDGQDHGINGHQRAFHLRRGRKTESFEGVLFISHAYLLKGGHEK